jgi:hypothetical protein
LAGSAEAALGNYESAHEYLSTVADEMQQAGVGFIDLVGNCRLVFDKVYIERRGFPKPKAERRPLRSLFSPKASRVLRVVVRKNTSLGLKRA